MFGQSPTGIPGTLAWWTLYVLIAYRLVKGW